jgi:hypothetical protein
MVTAMRPDVLGRRLPPGRFSFQLAEKITDALLDSGKTFVALLDEAVTPGKLPGSKIFPCIQGDGVWYLDFTQ